METQEYKHKVKFKASLSNGQTIYEGKAPFEEIPQEKSPWQRFIRYVIEQKLQITSMALYTDDGRTFNLPSLGKNPKFKAFATAEKPIDYGVFRIVSRDIDVVGDKQKVEIDEWFTVAEAIYSDYKLQIWVSEKNTQNSWVLVVKE